jgi:hypothetical protein
MTGIINYLDPVEAGLSTLIGEIYSEGGVYLFVFDKEDSLQVGDRVDFSVDPDSGMAMLSDSSSLSSRRVPA